jgi:sugar phosphate isomerase/epimerase
VTAEPRANRVCVSGMAATSWPLPDELAMYRRTGADCAGLVAAKLAAVGWEAAYDMIARSGTDIEYLVHAFIADPADDAGWGRQVADLLAAVTAAGRIGARTVYLTVGPSGAVSVEEAADRFAARMRPVVERAGELGIALALENTLQVRCDLYCCRQEAGLRETLRAEADRIRLLQVSDFRVGTLTFPNRWVPGDGDLPMAGLLDAALAAGYRGTVDIELIGPGIDAEGPESALTRAVEWTAARLGRAR